MRKIVLIMKTILIEAVRRREIYAVVLLSCVMIAVVGSIRFFNLPNLGVFYRETALKIMGVASTLTIIILAARQLPREFERRTIYTLLAKPVGRGQFLIGKFLGVMGAGVFCYALFMIIFTAGLFYLKTRVQWTLLAQHIYLQILALAIIASLAFMLSLIGNLDMAITVSALIYLLAQVFTASLTLVYGYVGAVGKGLLLALNYLVPQLSLFSLSAKVAHGDLWAPVSAKVMVTLTLYAACYVFVFLFISYLLFRRRPL